MSEPQRNFLSACLSGQAFLSDVDDWVEEWHASPDPALKSMSLDDYLGLSSEDGALFAERPEVLRFIVAAHRRDVPLLKIMSSQEDWAVAARSESEDDAHAVIDWLRETHRL